MIGKRGQVTVFIIVAVILIAGVGAYFLFRNSIKISSLPQSLEPIYNDFLSCLGDKGKVGIDILSSQGGYIEMPEFEPGSKYMPFSSQLDFLGNPVPYWYYKSGNNIEREQVPTKTFMQNELESFMESKAKDCNFDRYYEEGFEIEFVGEPNAEVLIRTDDVEINLDLGISIKKGEDFVYVKDHDIFIKSRLGSLYDTAKSVYDYEQKSLFLEEYGIDTLRLYAPVDGVELTCSPEVWNAEEVFDNLREAIELNTMALRAKTNDFSLSKEENKYFVVDVPLKEKNQVRFLNSREWVNGFEVSPSEGAILMAKPVGTQPGLGILGFCYAPYHFVYNVRYPVLVQIISDYGFDDEVFQFPMAVIIQGNNPREALETDSVEFELPELCTYKNTLVDVNVYDTRLNPVGDAEIDFECFGGRCEIGKTNSEGSLSENFPQCVNGFIVVRADGFEESSNIYSTTDEGVKDIILDKLYEKEIHLKIDGKDYDGSALISFSSDDVSKTVVYPETRTVELSEGQYEIRVDVYRNSSLKFQGQTSKQCTEVPREGIGGLIGLTEEKCFTVEIPDQIVSNVLSGGGIENYYFLESELMGLSLIEIDTKALPVPKTLEELQTNYILFEEGELDISFN